MLMSAGLEPPASLKVHGYLLVGGEKMSKTRLNHIAPSDLVDDFGVDGFRYHFLRDQNFGPDGEFSYEERARFTESVEFLTRGRLAGSASQALLARVVEQHQSGERAARIATIKERLTSVEVRRIALVLASDMAAADGVLHDAEREVILSLADALEVSRAEVEELVGDLPAG